MAGDANPREAVEIREFQFVQDGSLVVEILRQSKQATLWTETDLLLLRTLSGGSAFVSLANGRVSGVIMGRIAADEAEILNLAVREDDRRKGAGKRLVHRLLSEFYAKGVTRVFLEVRESNRAAIAFYESLSFRHVGRRKGYYYDPVEDALVMERTLENSTALPG